MNVSIVTLLVTFGVCSVLVDASSLRYDVRRGTDYPGNDIQINRGVATEAACWKSCKNHPTCHVAVYSASQKDCWLKNIKALTAASVSHPERNTFRDV
ncbi:hypothetical protein BV898_10940 [Hypsibius exemplaris]|uniref:Apple domain-containing protein n=1 Tax=Hypsibius exemplaris TaxID=2072580 RepID=A0A1W0WIA3_HYPEX|nr:hypothetical protein BV898_10940 [Hypsibius exemplaris]